MPQILLYYAMPDSTLIKHRAQMHPQPLPRCHEGTGTIQLTAVLAEKELAGRKLAFFHDDLLPPGTSIGIHTHTSDEEYYFIVSGKGIMTLNGQRYDVAAGDVTAVYPGGSHGLENPGPDVLRVLVIGLA